MQPNKIFVVHRQSMGVKFTDIEILLIYLINMTPK